MDRCAARRISGVGGYDKPRSPTGLDDEIAEFIDQTTMWSERAYTDEVTKVENESRGHKVSQNSVSESVSSGTSRLTKWWKR